MLIAPPVQRNPTMCVMTYRHPMAAMAVTVVRAVGAGKVVQSPSITLTQLSCARC